MAIFKIVQGPDKGREVPIQPDWEDFTIGRDPGNAIILRDPSVASHHVRILKRGQAYHLADLGGPAGTFVNNEPVKNHLLQSADQIRLGDVILRYGEEPQAEEVIDDGVPFVTITEVARTRDEEAPVAAPKPGKPAPAPRPTPQPAPPPQAIPQPTLQPEPAPPPTPQPTPRPEPAPQPAPPPAPTARPTPRPAPPPTEEPAVAEEKRQLTETTTDVEPVEVAATISEALPAPAVGAEQSTAVETGRVRTGPPIVRTELTKPLLKTVVCPNCWHGFVPEDVLFVARHPELINDPVVGADQAKRFRPLRFTVKGEALDEKSFPTTARACPRCHLSLPEGSLELPPVFISIVGSPASGKSYFLTSMTWKLRELMPRFGLEFSDADPAANSVIQEGETRLFLNPQRDEYTEIRKTDQRDPRLHKTVQIDGVAVRYPIPFQFALSPTREHAHYQERRKLARMVVLYDNAGEDWLPQDERGTPAAIFHIARSDAIFFVFDPIQDPRFRAQCKSKDPQLTDGLRPGADGAPVQYRQDTIVRELAVRIRQHLGLSQDKQIAAPIVVAVAKFDIWQDLLGLSIEDEPSVQMGRDRTAWLDLDRIGRASSAIRDVFRRVCPEIVAIIEGLSPHVSYVPVTALGHSPTPVLRGGMKFYGVRPRDVHAKWVTIPFLYYLCRWGQKGLVAGSTAFA